MSKCCDVHGSQDSHVGGDAQNGAKAEKNDVEWIEAVAISY